MMDVEKQAELKLYKKILIRLYCYKVKYQKWCSGKSHKKGGSILLVVSIRSIMRRCMGIGKWRTNAQSLCGAD